MTRSGSVSSLSPQLFPLVSRLISSRACWADCWDGRSPLCFRLFAFVFPLVSSLACGSGCCYEMVWIGQLFVPPLVSSHVLAGAGRCHEMAWLAPLVSALLQESGLPQAMFHEVWLQLSGVFGGGICHGQVRLLPVK